MFGTVDILNTDIAILLLKCSISLEIHSSHEIFWLSDVFFIWTLWSLGLAYLFYYWILRVSDMHVFRDVVDIRLHTFHFACDPVDPEYRILSSCFVAGSVDQTLSFVVRS